MSRSVRSLRPSSSRKVSSARKRPQSAQSRARSSARSFEDDDTASPEERLATLATKCAKCQENGLMAELITLRIEILALARLCYGKLDPEVTLAQSRLAEAYLMSGLEKQAIEHASQALQRAEDYPLNDVIISASHTIGKGYVLIKDYERASEYLKKALRTSYKENGKDALSNCSILSSIAQLHAAQGNNKIVIQMLTRVMNLREPKVGHDHIDMIDTHLELARTLFNMEQEDECRASLERVIRIADDHIRNQEDDYLVLANDPRLEINQRREREKERGFDDEDEGDFNDEGAGVIDDSKINLKLSWKVADAYTLMASSYKRSSDVDNAQKFYTDARGMYRVLAVMQDTIGSSKGVESAKTKVLKIERELATLHIVMENYDQAAKHLEAVLSEQLESAPGGYYDLNVARTEQRLGDIYTLAHQDREAAKHFVNAIDLYSTLYGKTHSTVKELESRLDSLNLESGDDEDGPIEEDSFNWGMDRNAKDERRSSTSSRRDNREVEGRRRSSTKESVLQDLESGAKSEDKPKADHRENTDDKEKLKDNGSQKDLKRKDSQEDLGESKDYDFLD